MGVKPLIVACDPSSKRLAFFATQAITQTHVAQAYMISRTKSAKFTQDNLVRAEAASLDFLETADRMLPRGADKFLVIEKPLVGRGGANATIVQSLVSGVVQKCFRQHGYTVHMVPVPTWKALLGVAGKRTRTGNKKHQRKDGDGSMTNFTKLALQGEYPKQVMLCGDDADLIDALGIHVWGMDAHRRGNLVVEVCDV